MRGRRLAGTTLSYSSAASDGYKGQGRMSIKQLGACMWNWAHVFKTVGCMYADFGCMSMERLGACMRMSGACL